MLMLMQKHGPLVVLVPAAEPRVLLLQYISASCC